MPTPKLKPTCPTTGRVAFETEAEAWRDTEAHAGRAYRCAYCTHWHFVDGGSLSSDTDGRIVKEPGEI